jgi:GAF domain-containing protein
MHYGFAHLSCAIATQFSLEGDMTHADQLTILSRMVRAITSAHDSQEACVAVAEATTRLLGAAWTRVWADDPTERRLRAQAISAIDRETDDLINDLSVLSYGRGLVGRIVESRAPEYVRDIVHDPRWLNQRVASAGRIHGFAGLPLVTGDRVVGVLSILFSEPRDFGPDDKSLMELLAEHAAIALGQHKRPSEARAPLETVEIVRQSEMKLKETETLLTVSRALSSTLDIGPLLRHFLRRVAGVLGADSIGSYLLDPDGEWLIPLQGYRLPPERLEALRALRLSIVQHAFYAEGARTKQPVVSSDAMHDPRIPAVIMQAAAHRSEVFVPIVADDQVVGGLVAAWWDRARDFSENDLALIAAIAAPARVVLENARLFQQDRRQRKELSVVHALSRAVTGELDRRTLIEALYAQVALVLDARDLLILLRGAVEDEVLVALSIRDGEREAGSFERRSTAHVGLAGDVMKTGVPLRTVDYVRECSRHGIDPRSSSPGLQHWVGVPMTVGDTVLGVVALGSAERAFTDADERLLTNMAQLAAVALASARLFEERESAYSELYLLSLITNRAIRRWRGSDIESGR